MSKQNGNHGDIDYRAHFARYGLTAKSMAEACAMVRERLNRLLGQRVRRELERMRQKP